MLFIQLATGSGAIVVEQFDAERTPPILAKHGLTIAAGGTPLALIYLQQQRKHPDEPLFPNVRFASSPARRRHHRTCTQSFAESSGAPARSPAMASPRCPSSQ